MNYRIVVTVGLTAIVGAAKLISKLRSKADDEEETPQDDQESDEANASESDTQSSSDETTTHSRSSEYNSSEQKEPGRLTRGQRGVAHPSNSGRSASWGSKKFWITTLASNRRVERSKDSKCSSTMYPVISVR